MEVRKEMVLGISAFGHDTSACLVDKKSGVVNYAVAEERLTNVKHDSRFPIGGIKQCLEIARRMEGTITDIAINFNDSDFLVGALVSEIALLVNDHVAAEKLVRTIHDVYVINDYYLEGSVIKNLLDEKIEVLGLGKSVADTLKRRIAFYFNWAVKYKNVFHMIRDMFPELKVHKVNHHLCHAASAFINSGHSQSTILVLDGQGESDTVTIYRGDDSGIQLVSRTIWPNSLGIFYLNATTYLGFKLGDEYKVMGMAAYGTPKFYDVLKEMMSVSRNAELVFHETKYFCKQEMGSSGHIYYNFTKEFSKLVAPRLGKADLSCDHYDFAASVQKLTEEIGVELAKAAMNMTGETKLAIAGGVGLNGLMNEQIRTRSGCTDIFVYPAAGDDGTSIGAAQYIAFTSSGFQRKRINTCYYGYEPNSEEIYRSLHEKMIRFSKPELIQREIARALADGKIVARYNSRAEFGPRALGHRSILASPLEATMKDTLNLRIKHRESFRPFAPVCLRDRVHEYFEMDVDAPFMLLICRSKDRAKKEVPAVVHNDGTARVQTVTPEQNEDLYRIISEFEKITGTPVIINTSFNVNGETIVDTPIDAIESFGFMDIDYLAIGDFWVSKEENKEIFAKLSHDEYLEIRRSRFKEAYFESASILDLSYNNDYVFEPGLKNQIMRTVKRRIKKSPYFFKIAKSIQETFA